MIKNLKHLRTLHKMSQQHLADVILVSQQSVNKYENHNVEPDIDTLTKIAELFHVSIDYLVGRTDIMPMASNISTSTLTPEEQELVVLFQKLNDNQKQCILTLIKSYY